MFLALAVVGSLLDRNIPMALMPILAVLNYLLFFASDIFDGFSSAKSRVQNQAQETDKDVHQDAEEIEDGELVGPPLPFQSCANEIIKIKGDGKEKAAVPKLQEDYTAFRGKLQA